MSQARAALTLALLLGLQPVATDVYLPALPQLRLALGASMSAAQLTMSALILAFGLGQLVWGPVADRVGRRPVLLLGLALHTAASTGSALAGDIDWLIFARVLQGLSLASAVVVARAMVRDLYEPQQGAQVMALALSGLGVVAIVGPMLGGLVTGLAGWRATLGIVAVSAAATGLFVMLNVPETLQHRNPLATRVGPLLATWGRIARHRSFVAWAALLACSYGGLFTLLAGASFVYIGMLGLSPAACGALMASGSAAYLAGTLLCRRWIVRHGLAGAVRRGCFVTLAAGVAILLPPAFGVASVWSVLLPQWLYCFGHGIHQPCGQGGAVGPFPQHAGAASALSGFVLAATAFGVGSVLGQTLADSLWPFALLLAFWALATSVVGWTLVQRSGR